jgi:hypothetical protein
MRAALSHIEVEAPENKTHFAVDLVAFIGPEAGRGAEQFGFTLCTPSWFAENVSAPKGYWFPRHQLIVEAWDEGLVRRALHDLCVRTEGEDWGEIAIKLSRYGHWEFEDYRPYPG